MSGNRYNGISKGEYVCLREDQKSELLRFGVKYKVVDIISEEGVTFVQLIDGWNVQIAMIFPIEMFVPYQLMKKETEELERLEARFKIW